MFNQKRIWTAGAVTLAVLLGLLAILIGLQAGKQSAAALREGTNLSAHAVDYDSVTQADLPVAKTVCSVCGKEAYAIESRQQLAAFIKYTTAADRLAACYKVTYSPNAVGLDLSAWSSVCIGMNIEAVFSGHVDFSGETIKKPAAAVGFFPTAQNAEIRNLNVKQTGGNANALGNTASGTKVSGLMLTADYTGMTAAQTGGVFNTVTDCSFEDVTVTINSTGIIFSNFGGIAYQATDCTVSGYRLNLANYSYTYDSFGGVFCHTANVTITNSTIYMPNDSGQAHYVRRHDGVGGMISTATQNLLIDDCNVELGFTGFWQNQGANAGGIIWNYLCNLKSAAGNDATCVIRNCTVTGQNVVMKNDFWTSLFLARINARYTDGNYYFNVKLENCVSKVEQYQGTGVFFGGLCCFYMPDYKLDIVNCVNLTEGDFQTVFYAGDGNVNTYGAIVNITGCVNYANVTNVFTAGKNYGRSKVTIKGCKDYSTGSTNLVGSSVNGNITIEDTVYANASVNISGSGSANTTNVTPNAQYVPPETYIPAKVEVSATVANQGGSVTLTIDFKDLMPGYKIKELTISLLGEWSGSAYTELVHNFVTLTEVNGLAVGSGNIAASGVVTCTYTASAENRNIVINITLSNDTQEKTFKLYAGSNRLN